LDAETAALLSRGAKLTELLKQDQYAPLSVQNQIAIIFAGVRGYLTTIDITKIRAFEESLLKFVNSRPIFKPYMGIIASKLDEKLFGKLVGYFVQNKCSELKSAK